MAKREIWLSENEWGLKGSDHFEVCTRHYSKTAALAAAKKCQKESGIKHRVRKQSNVKVTGAAPHGKETER